VNAFSSGDSGEGAVLAVYVKNIVDKYQGFVLCFWRVRYLNKPINRSGETPYFSELVQ